MTTTIPQSRVLDAIRQLTHGGVPPSYAELQQELGLSSRANVHGLLHRMRERGLVTFEDGKARTLKIVETAERIDLDAMTTEQIGRLRERCEAALIRRWGT